MKWFFKGKDGGPASNVTGYWLFESKRFGSVVLLKFNRGSREAFHTHAFNALSWVFWGEIAEQLQTSDSNDPMYNMKASFKPVYTSRDRFHRVFGLTDKTWVLSFRGPWVKTWKEYFPVQNKYITLTHGRKRVYTDSDV